MNRVPLITVIAANMQTCEECGELMTPRFAVSPKQLALLHRSKQERIEWQIGRRTNGRFMKKVCANCGNYDWHTNLMPKAWSCWSDPLTNAQLFQFRKRPMWWYNRLTLKDGKFTCILADTESDAREYMKTDYVVMNWKVSELWYDRIVIVDEDGNESVASKGHCTYLFNNESDECVAVGFIQYRTPKSYRTDLDNADLIATRKALDAYTALTPKKPKSYPCYALPDSYFEGHLDHLTTQERAKFASDAGDHFADVFHEIIDDSKHDAALNEMEKFAIGDKTRTRKRIEFSYKSGGRSASLSIGTTVTILTHVGANVYVVRHDDGVNLWQADIHAEDLEPISD